MKLDINKLLTLFLLFFTLNVLASRSGSAFMFSKPTIYVPPAKKPNGQDRIIIKPFTPTGLFESNRTLYFSMEIPVTKQWGIQPEVGYIYNSFISDALFNKEKLSFDLRMSQRYYWPKSTLHGFYTGPEIFYKNINYNVGQYICTNWQADTTSPGSYKCTSVEQNIYDLKRQEFGLLFRIGFQPVLFKRIALDFSIGIGLKYIKATTQGKKHSVPYPGDSKSPDSEITVEKSGFSHSIPPSVKIGFVF
jgi:hypothetical protein